MIVFSVCNTCFQTFKLLVQPSDVTLVKQIASEDGYTCLCPRMCGGSINLVGDSTITAMEGKLKEPLSITGRELYQAVNGMGLSDEVPKDSATIEAILIANPVVGVVLEESSGGFYLHELKLENDITVHLAAGSKGARVLKMTKERK